MNFNIDIPKSDFKAYNSLPDTRKVAAFFGDSNRLRTVYGPKEENILRSTCRFIEPFITIDNFDDYLKELETVEVIFSSWTMPKLEPWHLDRMLALKAVFFAAGSVKYFAQSLLERGILVVSAWKENAIPTAEFAFAQILLSMKGCFRNQREFRGPEKFYSAFQGSGNFGEAVALLGLGEIGSRVAEHLKRTDLNVLAYDPYLSPDRAALLNVEPVTLKEAFSRAFVVSNHIPLLPETRGLITMELLSSMRKNATFINTARGAIVDENALIDVLRQRTDLQVLLDVTDPEPPVKGSLLYSLPNCHLTTHIAGAIHNETRRLARACIQEFDAWSRGQALRYAVDLKTLASMA